MSIHFLPLKSENEKGKKKKKTEMTPAIPAVGRLLFRRTLSSRTGWREALSLTQEKVRRR